MAEREDTIRGYYREALRFIDPSLREDAPMDEILVAADKRMERLKRRPVGKVRDELSALTEALLFVQQVQRGEEIVLPEDRPEPEPVADPALEEPAPAAEPTAPETEPQSEEQISAKITYEQAQTPPAATDSPEDAPAEDELPTTTEVVEPAQPQVYEPTDSSTPAVKLPEHKVIRPVPQKREEHRSYGRKSLAEVMTATSASPGKEATTATEQIDPELAALVETYGKNVQQLPEQRALPYLAGILLILWQVWLALFTGWTATRYVKWIIPEILPAVGWPTLVGLSALGAGAAALTGWLVWAYRRHTRCIALITHLSGLMSTLNLLAWHLAAGKIVLMQGPSMWRWITLGILWAIAALIATRYDLHVLSMQRRHERQQLRTTGSNT